MHKALRSSSEERVHELIQILRQRTQYVPERVLRRCVKQLNPDRIYCIKKTSSPDKFMNLATEEMIATSSRQVLSFVAVLFGDFKPAYFEETKKEKNFITGCLNTPGPVVALKRSVYSREQSIAKTYTLIILDCNG